MVDVRSVGSGKELVLQVQGPELIPSTPAKRWSTVVFMIPGQGKRRKVDLWNPVTNLPRPICKLQARWDRLHFNKWRCQTWWCTPLIPAPRRQRQVGLCESEASPVYIASFMPARAINWDPISKKFKVDSTWGMIIKPDLWPPCACTHICTQPDIHAPLYVLRHMHYTNNWGRIEWRNIGKDWLGKIS